MSPSIDNAPLDVFIQEDRSRPHVSHYRRRSLDCCQFSSLSYQRKAKYLSSTPSTSPAAGELLWREDPTLESHTAVVPHANHSASP